MERYQGVLNQIADDERRHEQLLSSVAQRGIAGRVDRIARQFYVGLHDPDPSIHLARIAALDGCVCEVFSLVLQSPTPSLSPPLRRVLSQIRRDEGRHVRIARRLALECGAAAQLLHEMDAEIRTAFTPVLGRYTDEFEGLGVNSNQLLRRVSRVAP